MHNLKTVGLNSAVCKQGLGTALIVKQVQQILKNNIFSDKVLEKQNTIRHNYFSFSCTCWWCYCDVANIILSSAEQLALTTSFLMSAYDHDTIEFA